MVLADLPASSGAEVATELGEKAVFVPTDVSAFYNTIKMFLYEFFFFSVRL